MYSKEEGGDSSHKAAISQFCKVTQNRCNSLGRARGIKREEAEALQHHGVAGKEGLAKTAKLGGSTKRAAMEAKGGSVL